MKTAAVMALLLAACASPPAPTWTKPDATDVDFRLAMADCRNHAATHPLIPKPASRPDETGGLGDIQAAPGMSVQDMAEFRRAVAECMSARGWNRR